ncbi:Transposable element Hobo transposase [Trichoplax sp. H2]|nr:Transposable element Hobo transposase [Trichoplax sp. H2]|eukprot:RDD45528.1 Transposable element Hobo transposase [Trichoplax sp. H2]
MNLDPEGMKSKLEKELRKRSGIYWLRDSVPRSKGRPSEVWKRFAIIYDEHGALDYAACRFCYQVYCYRTANGTSALIKHNCQEQAKHSDSGSGSTATATYASSSRSSKQGLPYEVKKYVMTALVEMCCQDLHPFTIVNGDGFRKFCQILLDCHSWAKHGLIAKDFLPDSATLEQVVNNQAEEIRNYLATFLSKSLNEHTLVSFTIDLWQANEVNDCMICVTLHYTDKNFRLHNRVLAGRSVTEDNWNAKGIKNEFTAIIQSFNLTQGGISHLIVMNNNNTLLIGENGLNGLFQSLPCACHRITAVMTHLFEHQIVKVEGAGIEQSVYKYYDDCPMVFDTIELCHKLADYCIKFGITDQLGLAFKIPDENSDWISVYDYFLTLEQNYDALVEVLNPLEASHMIQKINRHLLKEIATFVQLFSQATIELKTCWQPTLHLVTIWRYRLLKHCRHVLEDYNVEQESGSTVSVAKDSLLIKSLKNIVQDLILDHWLVDGYQLVATILDPRQKNLARLDVPTSQISLANKMLQDLYLAQTRNSACKTESQPSRNHFSDKEVDNFFIFSSESEDASDEGKISITEIQLYMETRLTKETRGQGKNLDILKWWQNHRTRYPILSQVARSILAIPAYCTATDFKYNQLGNGMTDKSITLNQQTINNMLMTCISVTANVGNPSVTGNGLSLPVMLASTTTLPTLDTSDLFSLN